ncbi:hypothetical protein [Haloarcula argentinensis]|uniref:Nudix hydrolase domain-containing protein n=1 Tax=Haloarcula argentinensis TaxID=43776 RepID=A0A830FUJ3_HALAR|nr:hypothetical protein [Haloarcula argentinensis]EMA19132.1 hypothetical protein C443_15976 [Haloarcula argentinensis DSM 12282]MDS0254377.1 hypothetical protein [Haloarcula argentinensis]GGM42182.1 hypothetical protein GCM10009006_24290 [Haloarcula argentinensis]
MTEFESVAAKVDSHAAVGITNDDGEVLLMNDGSHGWTLIAFPVDPTEDWTAVTRQEAESLLDVTVVLERIETVRRIDFHPESDNDQRFSIYHVIFNASIEGDVVVAESETTTDEDLTLKWFDSVPDNQEDEVADDIERFLEA